MIRCKSIDRRFRNGFKENISKGGPQCFLFFVSKKSSLAVKGLYALVIVCQKQNLNKASGKINYTLSEYTRCIFEDFHDVRFNPITIKEWSIVRYIVVKTNTKNILWISRLGVIREFNQ